MSKDHIDVGDMRWLDGPAGLNIRGRHPCVVTGHQGGLYAIRWPYGRLLVERSVFGGPIDAKSVDRRFWKLLCQWQVDAVRVLRLGKCEHEWEETNPVDIARRGQHHKQCLVCGAVNKYDSSD